MNPEKSHERERILVTGATGYVGSRLVRLLLENGYHVRATARSLSKLEGRKWASHPNAELIEMDVADVESIKRAVRDCQAVYYLVHSMNPQSSDFAKSDRIGAHNMVTALSTSTVKQLIYLGGLSGSGHNDQLSKHLSSRAEVETILKTGKVPLTTLRAAMIIGSGSASFEILRYLVDRLPFMVTPKWVSTPSQPIAIRNVLNYLMGCLEQPATTGQSFDIGGEEILTYRDLMNIYSQEAHLKRRRIIPVPVFTPRLSSYWIHLVTPVPAFIARPLAEGLRNPAVCKNNEIRQLIPQDLLDCRTAIRLALNRMQHQEIESHWTDAGKLWPLEWKSPDDPQWAGGTVYKDERTTVVAATTDQVWRAVVRLGGTTGYYYANWLWQLRGVIDKLIGGVGLRRGRRHEEELSVGDALDFWRVVHVEPKHLLILAAEMRLPGQAILQFEVTRLENNGTRITQTAKFLPNGLAGITYWAAVTPLHEAVFSGMLRGIAAASRKDQTSLSAKP